jgi:hypothetical protein
MKTPHPKRILALDVHPLSFGFAVLEGQNQLLDWGVRSFRHGVNAVKIPMSRKLTLLLDEYKPGMLLVKTPTRGNSRRMKMIATLAAAYHITMRTISAESIKQAFPQSNRNKHQLALAVAGHFSSLSHYMPPKRKPWKAEHYRTSIFEAVALGLSYFVSQFANKNAKI